MSKINEELIEKYKNDKVLIQTYYTDNNGINIDEIVNPIKIDNRQLISPIDNQQNYPACAGYSACTVIESLLWKRTGKLVQLDSKQVYAKSKTIDGSRNMEGTFLESALLAAIQLCEFDWLKNSKIETFGNTRNQQSIEKLKFLIHKNDFVVGGFDIDEKWYYCNNNDYIIKSGGRSLGGHAVVIAGYDQDGVYICNSWSKNWGSKGFGILPWELFLKEFRYGAYISF